MIHNHQPTIPLEIRRCGGCMRYFSLEQHTTRWRCPYCAPAAIDQRDEWVDKKDRSIRSLRGYITRLRGRR